MSRGEFKTGARCSVIQAWQEQQSSGWPAMAAIARQYGLYHLVMPKTVNQQCGA